MAFPVVFAFPQLLLLRLFGGYAAQMCAPLSAKVGSVVVCSASDSVAGVSILVTPKTVLGIGYRSAIDQKLSGTATRPEFSRPAKR